MIDVQISRYMEGQLKDALRDLEMPASYYDKAITAYNSLSTDLTSPNSELYQYDPQILLQGSIKIGTAVKPVTESGSYDVDIVCNLEGLAKREISQCDLKHLIGKEVQKYVEKHHMENSPVDGKRCWTLEYVDEANFHIDVLPTLDNSYEARLALALRGFPVSGDEAFFAYTDKRHKEYKQICANWPTTNPTGYADWFLNAAEYEKYRADLAHIRAATIDKIKVYDVKAPLQRYVQLLKRHRDIYDDKHSKSRTISSIVLTTLAARAYEKIELHNQWYDDFVSMLQMLPAAIDQSEDTFTLLNPANPLENFIADWSEDNYDAFLNWHRAALDDFVLERKIKVRSRLNRYARRDLRLSLGLSEGRPSGADTARSFVDRLSHHRQHGLTEIDAVQVKITAEKQRRGGLFTAFESDSPLPKDISLRFTAHADGIRNYTVSWQVTNDGKEALMANCLRGDFYESITSAKGKQIRTETTRYIGRHYVECLLEKDNVVYGRSEPFVVNIAEGDIGHINWK